MLFAPDEEGSTGQRVDAQAFDARSLLAEGSQSVPGDGATSGVPSPPCSGSF